VKRAATAVVAGYALLAILVVPVYPHFASPNEFTRWALVASVIEDGRVEVSSVAPILGPRFEDLALIGGRVYSNKAPGAALVSLPGYLLVRPWVGPPSASQLRPALDAMRLFGATLPLCLAALLLASLGRAHGISEERTATVVWILLFATPLFAYGLLLFSHALVAATLFAAWALLYGFPNQTQVRRAWLAGACLGIAVMSEYPAMVALLALTIALALQRDWRRLLAVAGGGAPFAALLAAYQWLAFGNPFRLSYGYNKVTEYRAVEQHGIAGVGIPSVVTVAKLLAHPAKGLLVFAPVLLLVIPAFAPAGRRLGRAAAATLIAIPATLLLVHAGFPGWDGGWDVGPRFLVSSIPFLVVPLLFRDGSRLESFLAGASTLAVALSTLVFPFIPTEMPIPWGTLALPLLRHGLVMPNLLHYVGRGAAIFVPFAIVAAAAMLAGRRKAGMVLGGIGAMLVIGILAGIAFDRPLLRLERGYFAETYFGRVGALAEEVAPLPVPASLRARERGELATPPTRWPF
jgi:hypothetical protein